MARSTVKKIIAFLENLLGIHSPKSKPLGERVKAIQETIQKQYLKHYGTLVREKLLEIITLVKSSAVPYVLPIYINIKAAFIVSAEMLQQFILRSLKNVQAVFYFTQVSVVLLLQGNYSLQRTK